MAFQVRGLYHSGMSIGDQLREAIRSAGVSQSEVGRQAGIPQPMLSRFMQGEGIRLDTIERLTKYFGLKLTPTDGQAKKTPPKKKRK